MDRDERKAAVADVLIRALGSGGQLFFCSIEPNAALDLRDGPTFDAEWVRVHDGLLSAGLDPKTDRLAEWEERVFSRCYELGYPGEVAEYVVDDLSLLLTAVDQRVEDPWLAALLSRYLRGTFPFGELEPESRSFDEVLSAL